MNCVQHPDAPRSVWQGVLCKSCYYRMRRDIAELVFAQEWLRAGMVKRPQWGAERVQGSKEAPAPLRLAFLEQALKIEGLLGKIAKDLYGGKDRGLSVEETARRVLLKSGDLAGHPSIPQILTALHNVKEKAHKLYPWRRAHTKLPVPCPTCNLLTLTLYQGDSWVTCRNAECTEVAMPFFRYDRWIKYLMEVHGERINEIRSKGVRGSRTTRV